MTSLTIRNIDDALKSSLRMQAARHGHSMEQEVREILRRAVQPASTNTDFAQRIQKRFAGLGVEELPIPKRRGSRPPATAKA